MDRLTLAAAVTTSLAMIVWVLGKCHLGLDLADESYYLISISDPWAYGASVTQFGHIYHPLYVLLRGDIALLRQANILITLGLTWSFAFVVLRRAHIGRDHENQLLGTRLLGVSLVLATVSLALFRPWLAAPSYNSLALQAILITALGKFLAERSASHSSLLGWFFIGLGGWVAFMAKPTTAAVLGVLAGIWLILTGKLTIRGFAIALATAVALWVTSAWVIDGSIARFMARLIEGVEDGNRLAAGHTLSHAFRVDTVALGRKEALVLVATTLLLFAATNLSVSSGRTKQLVCDGTALLCALFSLSVIVGFAAPQRVPAEFRGVIWASTLGVVLAGLLAWHKSRYEVFVRNGTTLLLLLALPFAYAFGTNRNYWAAGSQVIVFWLLAGVVLLAAVAPRGSRLRTTLQAAVVTQTITVMLIHMSTEFPFRQTQPLRENQEVVRIASTGSEVLVSPEFAIYIRGLERLASRNGFKVGDGVIDLTGYSPGALYAIGARSIGSPWMIGGYAGSDVLARATLDRVACRDLVTAWLLIEPTGSRALSSELLRRYGISLQRDYVRVGSVRSWTFWQIDNGDQHLLRPSRSFDEAHDTCLRLRGDGQGAAR